MIFETYPSLGYEINAEFQDIMRKLCHYLKSNFHNCSVYWWSYYLSVPYLVLDVGSNEGAFSISIVDCGKTDLSEIEQLEFPIDHLYFEVENSVDAFYLAIVICQSLGVIKDNWLSLDSAITHI